ncbi:N-acetylmuramoyl-L-alanine amidase [Halobacillus halophilus]|uniref:N-acetylmuramoyl-L-alanine amidase n=1 Tax=Halobacillus halophilus TaxID=1570 RepID=UPI001CD46AC2|nr:N-acetylmuramoyl-L-alanine amidase [Halobacillus halophilus]MCA1009785.1 N-acetylmuramoyl-L-alanine amidase [Halobacillus halophilus]
MKKTIFAVLIFILGILCSSDLKAYADQMVVKEDVVNVRSGPGTHHEQITQVHKNEVYEYISEQGQWVQIQLSNNRQGWVAEWLVHKNDKTMDKKKNSHLSLNYNGTNIRSGPSTETSIVGRGHKNEQYKIIGKEGSWYEIRYQNQKAYVADWIVKTQQKQPVNYEVASDSQSNLNGKTIIIDAGHGGRDPGAIGFTGTLEKDLTLQTADALKQKLQSLGANVKLTRQKDEYLALAVRNYHSLQSKADAFISLHFNSAPVNISANGISSYYYHFEDQHLAELIQQEMVVETRMTDRGVRLGNFHVLRENNKPAVLLELGFISNKSEEGVVTSPSYHTTVGQGITKGLVRYFAE